MHSLSWASSGQGSPGGHLTLSQEVDGPGQPLASAQMHDCLKDGKEASV